MRTDALDKPKRWRPRWSVRTLVIVLTLFCAYLACWGPTQSEAVSDVPKHVPTVPGEHIVFVQAKLPLLVECGVHVSGQGSTLHGRYYFWFFGYVTKLKLETVEYAR